jgi:isopentenyl-diphosphate Delta-isomerase
MMEQYVILVDEQDGEIGTMEKMEAHRSANLHRAFSVFIFNEQEKLLLQQRNINKYHSGGLWTNTCCSHPQPGEGVEAAAARRLQEEMGFITPLFKAFEFVYQANFSNGLVEYEYDHVFIGTYNGLVQPDNNEVSNYCYQTIEEVKAGLSLKPDNYTEWFKIALPKLEAHLAEKDILD